MRVAGYSKNIIELNINKILSKVFNRKSCPLLPVKVAGVLLEDYDDRRDNTTNQRGGGNG